MRKVLFIVMEVQDKSKRLSYTREFKLRVIKWFMDNGQNKARTAFHLKADRKRIREWIQNEERW